ncbi:MAG: AtpZ/AtpI family protein [Phycisphaeraceae bacterium]
MAGKKSDRSASTKFRLAGMGLELAGAVSGGCVIGWYIDRQFEIEQQYGLLTGAIIGIVGGMYNLVRQSLSTIKDEQKHPEEPNDAMDRDH